MKTSLFLIVALVLGISFKVSAQENIWSPNYDSPDSFTKDKVAQRATFPKEFRLFNLNLEPLRQQLMSITDSRTHASTVISLPAMDGSMERFEIFEASNFDPKLQSQFPEIRAYSGKGLTDRYATLKLSISPQGIQTMVFRTENVLEFIEPFSADRAVYAVFRSQDRQKADLPWACSTEERGLMSDINTQMPENLVPESSAGQVKTMRLAQSVTAEYSNFFGATSSAQLNLVLAAINNTMTRANGVYEKDLAVHLNLIPNEAAIIYYDPNTDPYSPASTGAGGAWNGELQSNLTATIGAANYDIGHLFGATGGGGNAGCIGCVCVDTTKGRGFTSPADGIPQGDNFDIDYVVHEVGHQMGANHTYSFQNEGTAVQKEVGSGITIMGYAGITNQDVAPHSIETFHEASIAQIQTNLATKTCPVTVNMTANHPPVVTPVGPYTIPISTAFALTGVATDPEGDALTYQWEQDDNSTTTGNASCASIAKATGPNWLSFLPTISPTRTFPRLSTILAGLAVTPTLPGGDAVCNIEALSSISRTLNFRLTVRDNNPYVPGVKTGQTQFADTAVIVTNTAGPFKVTAPNTTGITYPGGSSQTITWDVANTTAAPVSVANVKISISYDGGQTFPVVLAASTANDGSESVTIPNTGTTQGRIKVEAIGNIFFDINDANFTVTGPTPTPTPTSTFTTTPTATATNTGTPSPSPTNTNTNTPTNTPTQGPTPCNVTTFSYSGTPAAIPDNVAAGVNFTIPVSGAATIADLNFRFDGTQSADPTSTTPGLNHSWVGDILVKVTSPGGTTVAVYDRPGVPASTFGCNSNNLAQLVLDDDGGFPSIENQCGADTNAAFPTGSFSPSNPLSAFDGQNPNGNWVINISDNAAGDTGTARAFSLVLGSACGSPTATSTGTPPPTSTNTATATNTATPTASPSCTPSERVADGTFEAGDPWSAWTVQTSTNFGTALCNTAGCGTGGGASPPFAGDNWAWFGGIAAPETATLGQTVTIPSGTATLTFQMRIGTVNAPFTDTLVVSIDGTQIASFTEPATAEAAYTLRTFDVSAFANGGSHALLFSYVGATSGLSSFVVDNVSIVAGCGTPGTPTATATASPSQTATATATATATGTPGCGTAVSYSGTPAAIPDNSAAGVNFTIPVSGIGTISDVNFRFDGTQSADPASTTPGINHSWVGDIIVKITSPGGTTVTAYDRPGVPVLSTVGCSNNNLAQIVLDDDGGFPAVEDQCNTTGTQTNNAFPTGSFSPNNALSAFDGQNANGNWVINISDNAGIDTGTARAFSLVFGGSCGSPSATPTATSTAGGGTPTATATPSCTAAWAAGPTQAPARYAIQGVLGTDNLLYVAGGQSADATPVLTNQVSRFNSATNTWSNVAPLPVALGQASVGAANGKIFVAGGFIGGTSVTNALRIYDIATNTWSSGADMPAAVEAAAGAVVNGKFYVMGGDDFNNGVNTTMIYDIATNTWSTGATLPDARTNTYGTAVGGLIYVYGGVNIVGTTFVTTDTLLRYDPVANSWTNLGSAGTSGARGNYGAVSSLGAGQLLITDGANASGVSTNATHIFNIGSGTFSAGPAMIGSRAGHAQALLPDGRVIVVDGFDTASTTTSNVELLTGVCPTATPTATSTSTGAPSNTPTATATSTPAAATVQFSSATYSEDESQVATITLNRSGNLSGTTTVNFATSDGTATGGASCSSGVDYISVSRSVTFNPNDASTTVNVQICSDTLAEPTQTINMTLSGATGGTVGSPATAVLSINDTASAYRSVGAICTTFAQPGSPYPSTINVANGPAQIGSLRVTLFDAAFTIPDSMDFLLVGPTGQKFILMADAGGTLDMATPVTLTFSDAAGQVVPDAGPLTTGVFEPTSWIPGQTSFPAPAPPAPYNEPGSTVGGTSTQTLIGNFGNTNGNGTWSLYMRDDAGNLTQAITGCVNGGWGLELFGSTAANASISGRVVTAEGQGIRNAKVVITGNSLSEPRITTTGSFGYFTFEGLRTGETYVVTVNSQRYTFSTPSRVVSLIDNIVDADFVANP